MAGELFFLPHSHLQLLRRSGPASSAGQYQDRHHKKHPVRNGPEVVSSIIGKIVLAVADSYCGGRLNSPSGYLSGARRKELRVAIRRVPYH